MSWQLQRRLKQWLADETGTVIKDWGGKIPVALVYPNRYFLGMSNLGFQTVYHRLNRLPNVVCERLFLPESEDIAAASSGPGPLSVESQRPMADFHIVAFSLAFENDFTNLVHLLQLGKLSLYSSRRHQHEPLVVAGGVATFLNPEPIAPFIDIFLLGEAENLLEDFISAWEKILDDDLSREEQLAYIAKRVSSAYVPSYFRVENGSDGRLISFEPLIDIPKKIPARPASLESEDPISSVITTPHTEFPDTVLVEIGRGCGRGCRFCAAGFVYRPVRHRQGDKVVQAALNRSPEGGKIGLLSSAVSDHPDIDAICLQLRKAGTSLSVSSLRADSVTPTMLDALSQSGLQTVTLAPEAGSERLRQVINKNLTEKQILDSVTAVVSAGILNLRLYFMIGLPTETEEDVAAIIDLVKRIKHEQLVIGRGQKRLGTITLSVSSFVPKPFTPFQWVPFCDLSVLKQRIKKLKRGLGAVANVKVHADVPRWAYIQAVLSRGDRQLAPLLAMLGQQKSNWSQATKAINVNPEFYVYREREREELLPWDFIDHGFSKDYLWNEYQAALAGETTPPCDPGNCVTCGVCGET
ncbi:MAG: radical SAM protein [Deltaproteobacteria bacterium]|nr:MAG: radical SAM protein [Deltaproteobacteria bacterium]